MEITNHYPTRSLIVFIATKHNDPKQILDNCIRIGGQDRSSCGCCNGGRTIYFNIDPGQRKIHSPELAKDCEVYLLNLDSQSYDRIYPLSGNVL